MQAHPKKGQISSVEAIQAQFNAMQSLAEGVGDLSETATGMSLPHITALRVVAFGARKVSDVAAAMRSHASSASRVVDHLVDDQLLTRTQDPNDRRAVVLGLTSKGEKAVDALTDMESRLMGEALGQWSEQERVIFGDLLERFVAGLVDAVAVERAAG